jgi:hypothetical protein
MLFFSVCIAPIINLTLDKKNSSKLLRKIFPRNFIYGLILSLLVIICSIYLKHKLSLTVSCIIFLLYIINLYVLIPKINLEADKSIKNKGYSKKFKVLHLFSVLIYIIQMLLSFAMIYRIVVF